MALKIDLVARMFGCAGAKEVVIAYFVERGRRGKGRDMTAGCRLVAVGAHDHSHGVPAHDALYAALDFAAAGERWLFGTRNSIDIWGIGRKRQIYTGAIGPQLKLF